MSTQTMMRDLYDDRICDLKNKEKAAHIAFIDEVLGCRILVFKEPLPKKILQKLVPAYIIAAGKYPEIKAFKCAYVEDEQIYTFSWKRFPDFWQVFRKCFDNTEKALDRIDLSLLNTDTRKAELKGKEIVFTSRNIRQSDKSKLQSLRDNPDVLFIRDTKTNILHDKSCEDLDKIPFENLEVFQGSLIEEYHYCRHCRDRSHIRLACGDDFKHFSMYKRFLKDGGLSEYEIECYTRQNDFHMRLVGSDTLQIKANEDTWQIIKTRKHRYTLMHNNYCISDAGERLISGNKEFHVQCHHYILEPLFEKLSSYSYEKYHETAELNAPETQD